MNQRRLACALSALLWLGPATTPATGEPGTVETATADELVGLWRAEQRFGPDARGPLILERTPAGWTADFMGRTHLVRTTGRSLSFDLGNGEGNFLGRLHDGDQVITGHWTPPNSKVHGFRYAAPVKLEADGTDRWRGERRSAPRRVHALSDGGKAAGRDDRRLPAQSRAKHRGVQRRGPPRAERRHGSTDRPRTGREGRMACCSRHSSTAKTASSRSPFRTGAAPTTSGATSIPTVDSSRAVALRIATCTGRPRRATTAGRPRLSRTSTSIAAESSDSSR